MFATFIELFATFIEFHSEYGVRHKDKNGDYFFENIGCYNIEIVNMNKRY